MFLFCVFRNGVYPLTAYALPEHPAKTRPQTPETAESVKSTTPEPVEVESRAILRMQCETKEEEEGKVKVRKDKSFLFFCLF